MLADRMADQETNGPETANLTHLDEQGRARMVDVGSKDRSDREAVARAVLVMRPDTLERLRSGNVPKGDVLATARIAGIQAAKRTPELVPLCHHVALSACEVSFDVEPETGRLTVETRARARDRTGVEMEAMTAATVAALTVYDMLKAVERGIVITDVSLVEKSGGRSGHYVRS
jgi:cyclic pyranopterin phosphate synthase